jgi:hypothetical protein
MTKQHRATPKQWGTIENYADSSAPYSCFLELRARIEALEAAQHAHVDTSHLTDAIRKQICEELARPAAWRPLKVATETTYGDAKPVPLFSAEEVARIVAPNSSAASLVERVSRALEHAPCEMGYDRPAHAAILEVAAWLTENYARDVASPPPCQMLRDEANR